MGTKQGHIFVLHRETGEPLFPVEERPVPQTDVPGEETWPTQPFPAQLPLFGLRELTPDDAWGPTAEDRETGRQVIAAFRSEGPFTPISLQGTIQTPSNSGGFNWGGLSYDPTRQILVGAVNRFAAVMQLMPRDEAPPARRAASGSAWKPRSSAARPTPWRAACSSIRRRCCRSARRRGARWRRSTSAMARSPGKFRWGWWPIPPSCQTR